MYFAVSFDLYVIAITTKSRSSLYKFSPPSVTSGSMIDGMLPFVIWIDLIRENSTTHDGTIDRSDQKGVKIEHSCQKAQKGNKRAGGIWQ